MVSHVPDKNQHTVRFYGAYSNRSRGKARQIGREAMIPDVLEPEISSTEFRRNWARLIRKIHEVDPLCCPKCQGRMKVISVIENEQVIEKILKHLGLWNVKARPPPKTSTPHPNVQLDNVYFHESRVDSQVPPCEDYLFHDPEYPIEAYI